MEQQLKTRQICFFLLAFIPLSKVFALPSLLAKTAGEDLWLCTLILVIFDLLTLAVIVYACKKSQCDFFTLLENNFGKIGSKIILILYFIYFMLKAVIPLNEQKDYVELTLYTLKPTILYFLPFFILPFYLCMKKIRVLGRISDVLWLVTVNGVLTLFILALDNADFSAILPIGASGFNSIIKGAYLASSRFGDCVYVMFFIGQFAYRKKDCIKILLSYLGGAIMIISFMIIFYCVFTSIAFRQRFALTEISKYSTVINNLGRFDYISIIMILFSNLFSLALPFYFSAIIFNRVFNVKSPWIAPSVIVTIQFIVCVLLPQFTVSIENFILNFCGFLFIILSNVFPLLFCLLCKKDGALNYEKG